MLPNEPKLSRGDVVQLDPSVTENPAFKGCFMIVLELTEWGAIGMVQDVGNRQMMGGRFEYRASWEEMEYVGPSVWMGDY